MNNVDEVVYRFFTLVFEISELHAVETKVFKLLYSLATSGQEEQFKAELKFVKNIEEFHETNNKVIKFYGEKARDIVKPVMDMFLTLSKKLPKNKEAGEGFERQIKALDKQIEMVRNLRKVLEEKMDIVAAGGRYLN